MGYIDDRSAEHLSPTRSNGLTSMIKQMKLYALVLRPGRNKLLMPQENHHIPVFLSDRPSRLLFRRISGMCLISVRYVKDMEFR